MWLIQKTTEGMGHWGSLSEGKLMQEENTFRLAGTYNLVHNSMVMVQHEVLLWMTYYPDFSQVSVETNSFYATFSTMALVKVGMIFKHKLYFFRKLVRILQNSCSTKVWFSRSSFGVIINQTWLCYTAVR